MGYRASCPLLRAAARAMPDACFRLQARLRGDDDDPVSGPQFVAAAVDCVLFGRDARFGDDAGAQEHPVTGHAGDVALQPAKIIEEDFVRLPLALGPAFSDIFVPVLDLLLGAWQDSIGRPAGLLPRPHEIGPPVRRRGAELSDLGYRIDAGGLAGDLAAVAERHRHFGLRDDRRAHDDLAAWTAQNH